uniref:Uncharacterized protein TCIL3000_8_4850 n=1 Tax=Trypanosoma congolense (strain IL3000) TaxID=1068625 RepID=G0USA0_TRYCI|nr:unnamed protein product [Trypanosoma congolense IL3000]
MYAVSRLYKCSPPSFISFSLDFLVVVVVQAFFRFKSFVLSFAFNHHSLLLLSLLLMLLLYVIHKYDTIPLAVLNAASAVANSGANLNHLSVVEREVRESLQKNKRSEREDADPNVTAALFFFFLFYGSSTWASKTTFVCDVGTHTNFAYGSSAGGIFAQRVMAYMLPRSFLFLSIFFFCGWALLFHRREVWQVVPIWWRAFRAVSCSCAAARTISRFSLLIYSPSSLRTQHISFLCISLVPQTCSRYFRNVEIR